MTAPLSHNLLAGTDEAGRGPLAGPVVASAVMLCPDRPIIGLCDSKKLSPGQRQVLAEQIRQQAVCWSIGIVEHQMIDQINILQASLLAMKKAIESLDTTPDFVIVDGNKAPAIHHPHRCQIKADRDVPCVSAASILAKVVRDEVMMQAHLKYPEYGFNQHKGYPTKAHLAALHQHGPCPIHRTSFAPVRFAIEKSAT
jgi:ribonuclease HII